MRTTKNMLEARMKSFCKLIGKEIGCSPGQWNLENYPLYGGWIVVEYGENGTESHPLSSNRVSAKQMHDMLYFASAALQLRLKRE